MTGPKPGGYDRRILNHPEYARSYHYYIRQGTPPDQAAYWAYEWTRQSLPPARVGSRPTSPAAPLVVGIVGVALLLLCGIGAIGSALTDETDTASVDASATSEPPSTATLRPSEPAALQTPTPTDSPTAAPTVAPTPSPTLAKPAAPPRPTAAPPRPTAARPQPVAPRTTRPTPPPATPTRNCDPSYPDVCLKVGVGDYDCAGGSGNGPNYVPGPFRVRPPDPFRLDADNDGIGCED